MEKIVIMIITPLQASGVPLRYGAVGCVHFQGGGDEEDVFPGEQGWNTQPRQ